MPADRPYVHAELTTAAQVAAKSIIDFRSPGSPEPLAIILARAVLDAVAPLITARVRAQVAEERDRQSVAAALRWTAMYHGGTALHALAEQVAADDPRAGDLMRYVQRTHATTEEDHHAI